MSVLGATSLALTIAASAPQEIAPPPEPSASLTPDEPARSDAMFIGGLSTIMVGVPTLGLGAAFLVLDRHPGEDIPTEVRNFTMPGAVLTAAGGALVITGAALLAIDLVRRKQRDARLSWSPSMGRRSVGFSLSGRF